MNVTVIKLKDLLKYLVGTAIMIIIVACATSFFNQNNKENKNIDLKIRWDEVFNNIKNKSVSFILKNTMPITNTQDDKNQEKYKSNQEKIFDINLLMASNLKKVEMNEKEIKAKEIEEEKNEDIELAKTNVTTQEVEENNIAPSYTDIYEDILIKNQSSHEITDDLFQEEYEFKNLKEILIYHTHTCESYTQSEEYNYEMTGAYRTTDLDYTVSRVGDELDKQLSNYGYNITHDKTYHDYPAYNGSYDRSQETVTQILNQNPNIQTAIDLHRDAVGSNSDYAPSVLIDGESCAQLMFVIRNRWRWIVASKMETKF